MTKPQHEIEEIFKGCISTLRVLKYFMLCNEPVSKYTIQKDMMISVSDSLLERLCRQGVLIKYSYGVTKYKMNRNNKLVILMEEFFKKIGYIS